MSTKLSQKLERINASMVRIREKTNLPNAVIEDVATAVEQLGTSGGETTKTNIYKVSSIAERDAITDMVEGDMCVVHTSSIANMQATDSVTAITFPATVVLPSAFTSNVYASLRDTDRTLDIMVDLSQTRMRCDIMGDDYISISYTSTDGITYTRTDANAETIEFNSAVSLPYPDEWDDALGYFLQVGGVEFGGLFEYIEGTWNYSNIGISLNTDNLMPGSKAYSNKGVVEGTFFKVEELEDYKTLEGMLDNVQTLDITGQAFRTDSKKTRFIEDAIDFESLETLYDLHWNNSGSLMCNELELKGLNLNVEDLPTSGMNPLYGAKVNKFSFHDMFIYNTKIASWFGRISTYGDSKYYVFEDSYRKLYNLYLPNCTSMYGIFANNSCHTIEIKNIIAPNMTDIGGLFVYDSSIKKCVVDIKSDNITTMNSICNGCSSLIEADLSTIKSSKVTSMYGVFKDCKKLEKLDIRSMSFESVTEYTDMFTNVPATCLIIVKDATAKSWITSKFTNLTNVKTVAEYGG